MRREEVETTRSELGSDAVQHVAHDGDGAGLPLVQAASQPTAFGALGGIAARVSRRLVQVESTLAALSLLLLLTLVLAQILLRNVYNVGLPIAETLSRYLVLYVTFFGAALAIGEDRHIQMDVLVRWLPRSWQLRLHRMLATIAVAVASAFTLAAGRVWLDEWRYAPDAERWLAVLIAIVPLGFGLLSVHFLLAIAVSPRAAE